MLDGLFGSNKADKKPQRSAIAAMLDSRDDSAVGSHAVLNGSIISRGEVRIYGEANGDVTTSSEVLIGDKGKLKGNLICESVAVNGTLEGDIVAYKVTVGGSGVITGQVRAVSFTSAEGGVIRGTVTMEETLDIEAIFREAAGLPPVEPEPEPAPKKRGRSKKKEEEPAPAPAKPEVPAEKSQ